MISTFKTYPLFGLLCGVIALTTAPGLAQQRSGGSAAAEAAIGKLRTAYQAAANAQDGAAMAKLFAQDGTEMPPNAPLQKGRAAIEAYHKNFANQVMVHNLVIKTTETHVMGDVAYDVGTYSQSLMPMKGGGKTMDDKGKYVVLLKKDASGGWLITHAIYNSDIPLPPPPPAK
jgi:uncharacterized protein (TIGR02246 family)